MNPKQAKVQIPEGDKTGPEEKQHDLHSLALLSEYAGLLSLLSFL